MFRKLIVRLFLGCFAVIAIIVVAGCVAGYLALRPPAFYASLRAQQFSQSEQIAAKSSFELAVKDLGRWSDRSIAIQRSQLSDSATPWTVIFDALLSDYDPTQDTHSVSVTEKQINAQLASGKAGVKGELQNPRIRIGRDRIDFASEVVTSKASCVLSVGLKPTIAADGRLHLDFMALRIGQLPIPLKVLSWLPREFCRCGNGMELNLTAPTPYLCLNVSDSASKAPAIKSIECGEEEMTIVFSAPVLKRVKNESRNQTSAMSEMQ